MSVSFCRQAVYNRAPGETEVEELGNLVKGFAGGIVNRAAKQLILSVVTNVYQQGMAAGHRQTDMWEWYFRIAQQVGEDVPFDVMHPD